MSRIERYIDKTPKEKRNQAAMAYLTSLDHIETVDPKISSAIVNELNDQRSHLKLIASENFSSLAVQLAMGNLMTDKYAEGYAHHRFYAGCENVDNVEELAQNRLKELFGCENAYVQPHSGADANIVAFWSILIENVQSKEIEKLGKKSLDELTKEEYNKIRSIMMNQKLMGMSLNSGGHLTHGYIHNISSKMMQAVDYDVDPETELLNYDTLAEQAKKNKPNILLAGYSSYPRKINFAKMKEIADSVGATFMVDMAHFSGLVAGKVFSGDYDPVPFADVITSTTHKTLRGPRGGLILCKDKYKETVFKGCPLVLGGPLPHVIAAKAIAFKEALTPDFRDYAKKVVDNSQHLAARFKEKGVKLFTNGTDNHLIIINLSQFNLTGRHAETALRNAKLTSNRNTIPFDQNGPWYTTGIRIGTPAVTSLGMGKEEMVEIADIIIEILTNTKPNIVERTGKPSKAKCTTVPHVLESARQRVADLLAHYPLYPEIDLESDHTGVTSGNLS